jgi:tetratricopeptide (TPR) repeat protein
VNDAEDAFGTPAGHGEDLYPKTKKPATLGGADCGDGLLRSDPVETGERVIAGRYRIIRRLGRGGMGEVYRARDRSTGGDLALKRIRGEEAATEDAQMRFRREFHVMAGLRHPHVVDVYDYGLDDKDPYYTMELLDGSDLRELGPMPWREACAVLREVAVALTFLHSRRLLHRDLAPRNIRCTADGHAKLIDFGVLATFGIADDVAGTPPLIAPETLRGLPLDQRADLFGLGALAYWVLTGQHAFKAKKLGQLERLWREPIAPPSQLVEDVPKALDELVVALLCIDSLGRPRSAVEVVDRLSAVADLPPLQTDVARGFVASAAMVGRGPQVAKIKAAAREAVAGTGRYLLVAGASGEGKSRLLRESVFEAQLAGASVVSVDCGAAGRGPYGVFRELAQALLRATPQEARDAVRELPLLADVVPELGAVIPAEALAESGADADISDPAEIRLRIQAAAHRWVSEVASARPLAILVDDVQRCDDASLAVLSSLSRSVDRVPMLMVTALRTDETPHFPGAVAALVDAGESMRLRGLTFEQTEELVVSVFGDVPRTAYLARWMHETTGGSPLHITELCRYVVTEQIVTHHDGMWILPGQFAEKKVPADLKAALDAGIAPLSSDARALGEALAIKGGELTLGLALDLSPSEGDDDLHEPRVFSAIDELVRLEVLVGTGQRYRFRHDGLREALLRGLDEQRRSMLHRWVGEVLERQIGQDPERELDVGWHFHRGGETRRGAEYLERAGRRLFEAQAMGDAIAPLETALLTYGDAGDESTGHLDLQFMIIVAGALSDRDAAWRHVNSALVAFQRQSGVAIAVRLARFTGRHLGLLLGIGAAMVRWVFSSPSRRGLSPMVAVTRYMLTIAHASYICFATHDVAGFRRLMEWMAPMNAFRGLGPHGAYNGQLGMLDIVLGRLSDAKRRLRIAADSIMVDRITPTTEFERRLIEAASRGFLVLAGVFQLDADVDPQLERIAELDLRYFDFGARTAQAIRHRLNGREEAALAITREQETTALQLGAGWHLEAMLITYSSLAYALCRDILGLKRCVEELTRLVDTGFHFRPQLLLAAGEYHRERGELDEAEDFLRRAMEALDDEEATIRQWATAARVEVALGRGEVKTAIELGTQALGLGQDPVSGQVLPRLRATRGLALAEAAAGDVDAARRRLQEALAEAEALANPPLVGLIHEACARIALAEGDRGSYEQHRVEVFRAVEPTRNPALIGLAQRLRDTGEAGTPQRDHVSQTLRAAAMTVEVPSSDGSMLSDCRGPVERATRALELLLASSTGRSGYLFVVGDDGLKLAAPMHASVPADVEALVRSMLSEQEGTSEGASEHQTQTHAAGFGPWAVVALTLEDATVARPVGAVAIRRGALDFQPPDPRLLVRLAAELFGAGDATGAPG